MRTKKIFV